MFKKSGGGGHCPPTFKSGGGAVAPPAPPSPTPLFRLVDKKITGMREMNLEL